MLLPCPTPAGLNTNHLLPTACSLQLATPVQPTHGQCQMGARTNAAFLDTLPCQCVEPCRTLASQAKIKAWSLFGSLSENLSRGTKTSPMSPNLNGIQRVTRWVARRSWLLDSTFASRQLRSSTVLTCNISVHFMEVASRKTCGALRRSSSPESALSRLPAGSWL